jgi:hypothetical protein
MINPVPAARNPPPELTGRPASGDGFEDFRLRYGLIEIRATSS